MLELLVSLSLSLTAPLPSDHFPLPGPLPPVLSSPLFPPLFHAPLLRKSSYPLTNPHTQPTASLKRKNASTNCAKAASTRSKPRLLLVVVQIDLGREEEEEEATRIIGTN